METKEQIREQLLEMRNTIEQRKMLIEAKALTERLKENPLIKERGYVYGYYPHKKELSLLPFLQWAIEAGKRIALPKIEGKNMFFYEIESLEEVKKGAFGVMEPITTNRVFWEDAVCLIPGVGFSEDGKRIGHGKAYYDKYLQEHTRLKKIGIAYEFQIIQEIPTELTDINMEHLVTPKRLIIC